MRNITIKSRGKSDNIEKMLKRFKRAFEESEIKHILTEKKQFLKPSVTKRRALQTAKWEQSKLDKLNKEEDGL